IKIKSGSLRIVVTVGYNRTGRLAPKESQEVSYSSLGLTLRPGAEAGFFPQPFKVAAKNGHH
ncbi:hypothetical protein, partial [Pseudomonas sp. ICMP 19500]